MPRFATTSVFLVIVLLTVWLALPSAQAQSVGSCTLGEASQILEINNVRARLHNTGTLFRRGSGAGLYNVPRTTNSNAIFQTSIWLAGKVDGAVRLAGTTFGPGEFWPGPLDAAGNPPANCETFDRIYSIRRLDLIQYDRDGVATRDLLEWPAHLGAPVADGDGNPDNYNLDGGDRPDLVGDQMVWWVMNDVGNVHNFGGTPPLGVEVQVTAFAFSRFDALGNTTFYKYKLINKGDQTLVDSYFGIWSDVDLGFPADDYVGSDSTLSLGFVWNGADLDPGGNGYGPRPPAIGFDFLQGPSVDGKPLGLAAFVYHTADASIQGNPQNAPDAYNYLQGRWRNGQPMTKGGTGLGFSGESTTFMFPDNPPEFWSEENTDGENNRSAPGDRRIVLSTGPFNFAPGETQEIVFAIIFAQGIDRFDSVQKLKRDDLVVQAGFDFDFGPGPRLDAPQVSYTPLNESVILTWDNEPGSNNFLDSFSENDPYLANQNFVDRAYEFEGYKVYQFAGPDDDEGELIATYDVVNGVTRVLEVVLIDPATGSAIQEVSADGTDSGVQHAHQVSGLTNFSSHYLGVQAYAYNSSSTPLVIASEISRIEVIPSPQTPTRGGTVLRSNAAGAEFSEINGRVTRNREGPGTVWATAVDPSSLTGDQYGVDFYDVDIDAQGVNRRVTTYDIKNLESGETLFDGASAAASLGSAPPQREDVLVAEGLSWSIVGPPPAPLTLPDNGGLGFIQVEGISDSDACGPGAGSRLGCEEIGGNIVYGSFNGEENWIMLNIGGDGPEERLRFFAPNDFELRVTGLGSSAFHAFTSGRAIRVPFELWDIGPTGPFGINDARDDIRLIPAILSDNGGECEFGFGEIAQDPFSLGWPVTDRIYAFYPVDGASYDEWDGAVTPLIEAHPDRCPLIGQGGEQAVLIDFARDRPIQRIAFTMNPDDEDYRSSMIPEGNVIRFLTNKPNQAGDSFVVSTFGFEPTTGDANAARAALASIQIVPNPYLGLSSYEIGLNDDLVRIVNLPERVDIRIFGLDGTLVTTFFKNSPDTFINWDVTTDEGLRLGSGMYLVHVDVPGVGAKVLKFGVRQKSRVPEE